MNKAARRNRTFQIRMMMVFVAVCGAVFGAMRFYLDSSTIIPVLPLLLGPAAIGRAWMRSRGRNGTLGAVAGGWLTVFPLFSVIAYSLGIEEEPGSALFVGIGTFFCGGLLGLAVDLSSWVVQRWINACRPEINPAQCNNAGPDTGTLGSK